MSIADVKRILRLRLRRNEQKAAEIVGNTPTNIHAAWSLGYLQGKITALEDAIDTLEDMQIPFKPEDLRKP